MRALLLNLTGLKERKAREKERLRSSKMEALVTMASGLKNELHRRLDPLITNTRDPGAAYAEMNHAPSGALERLAKNAEEFLSIVRKLEIIANRGSEYQNSRSFDLNEGVKEAVSTSVLKWKGFLEDRGVKIDFKTYLRSSSLVEGDPEGIKEAVSHLLNNAVEAMPNGGEVYITTEDNAGFAHIYIQDSGIGISEMEIDRVFDPFFTSKGDGFAGLGLSLCHAIIYGHGGDIEISSRKGLGSVFHILLPSIRKESTPRPKADRTRIREAQILIIQEDDIARELLSHLFINKGCRVDTAADGMEGLGKLKRKRFDLMIADMETLRFKEDIFLKKSRDIN